MRNSDPIVIVGAARTPMGGFQGPAADVEIHAKEILRIRERINDILAKHTGQPIEKIQEDSDRDLFMSGEEAKSYGIVDEVITRKPENQEKPS